MENGLNKKFLKQNLPPIAVDIHEEAMHGVYLIQREQFSQILN